MHNSSIAAMTKIVEYLDRLGRLSVVDIGSMDVNGSYRQLFKNHEYTGYDIAAGKNVDIIGGDVGLYKFPFEDWTFDVSISGQTIEHVADIYAWVKEMARIVKPCGYVAIIGPHTFHEHRYPIDCWRILPDGMKFLMKQIAGLDIIRVWKSDIDTIGIGRKP